MFVKAGQITLCSKIYLNYKSIELILVGVATKVLISQAKNI